MAPFGLFLLASSSPKTTTTINVCLSPGCIADCADKTLAKLTALAPPHVTVIPGGCESLCGKGPIISSIDNENDKKVLYRRVAGQSLVDLLLELNDGSNSDSIFDSSLIESYDIVQRAEDAFFEKRYHEAIELFDEGLAMALPLVLKGQRSQCNNDDNDTNNEHTTTPPPPPPPRFKWLISSYRHYATSLLEVSSNTQKNDNDDMLQNAMDMCWQSIKLSQNSDAMSFETMAVLCRAREDSQGEIKALRKMFALEPDGMDGLPFDVANRRRELGFRLAKLERDSKK